MTNTISPTGKWATDTLRGALRGARLPDLRRRRRAQALAARMDMLSGPIGQVPAHVMVDAMGQPVGRPIAGSPTWRRADVDGDGWSAVIVWQATT